MFTHYISTNNSSAYRYKADCILEQVVDIVLVLFYFFASSLNILLHNMKGILEREPPL